MFLIKSGKITFILGKDRVIAKKKHKDYRFYIFDTFSTNPNVKNIALRPPSMEGKPYNFEKVNRFYQRIN